MTSDELARLAVTSEAVRMAQGWTLEINGHDVHIRPEHLPADVLELCSAASGLLRRVAKLEGIDGLLDDIAEAHRRGDDEAVARLLDALSGGGRPELWP